MNNWNIILKDFAHKCGDGGPDMTNPRHLALLRESLIKFGWKENATNEFIGNLREGEEIVTEDWWSDKSPEEQAAYMKDHPGSKKAKDASKDDIEKVKKDDDSVDDKKVDSKEFKSDIDKNYYESDVNPSDEQYEKQKPEQLELKEGAEPLEFSDDEIEFLSDKFPKKYVKVLERIMNSKKTGTFSPNIKSFIDAAGAGQTSSTAGEIMTMMAVSMDEKQIGFLEQKLGEHFDNIGDSVKDSDLILDRDWLESAKAVRQGVSERYDDYYGKGKWEMVGAAWDTKSDVEAMGFDYSKKGFSTDTYFRLKVNGQDVLDELSLKKDFNVALSQPGVNEVFYWTLATNKQDKKEYDDIEEKLMAVDDKGKKVVKAKEAKELRARKKELLRKYQDILGEDGNPDVRQKRENKSSINYITNINKKQLDLLDKVTDDDIQSFSKFNATGYIKGLIPKLKTLKPPISNDDLKQILPKGKRGVKDFNKATIWTARILGKVGDKASADQVEERIDISATFSKAFVQNLVKVPALKKGITSTIREKFPLKALMSGEETMALGGVSADKKVMKEIFGTDNYDEVETNLNVDGPDKNGFYQLLYKVKSTDKVVNLAQLRARQRGIGYSTTPNFEMKLHEDFKGELYRSNVSLGRDVYDPAKTEKSSMKTKYGSK